MLLIVRHGESTWNAEHRWAGQADPPLSQRGRDQADALGTAIVGAGISGIVASDQIRARETAGLVASHLGIDEIIEEPRIRERHCGVWSGLSHEQIETEFPGMLDRWRRGERVDFVGGEPYDAFAERVMAGMAAIHSERADTDRILVVAHAGVLRVVAQHLGIALASSPNTAGLWLHLVDGHPHAAAPFDPSAAKPTTSFDEVSDAPETPTPATTEGGAAGPTGPSNASDAETTPVTTTEPVDLDAIEQDLTAVEVALNRLADGTYWIDEITEHVIARNPIARRA